MIMANGFKAIADQVSIRINDHSASLLTLYIHKFSCNSLSVSSLTKFLKCYVTLFLNYCLRRLVGEINV